MTGPNFDGGEPTIAVIGPGRMGTGIAQVMAANGAHVRVLDAKDRPEEETRDRFEHLRGTVRSNLALLAEFGAFDGDADAVLDRIVCTQSRTRALSAVDWLFEALPEDPAIKTELFESARNDIPDDAIVATTTSSISIDTLADAVPDRRRLLITHWLNPAFIVPLVEVARTDYTAETAVEATVELLEAVGKDPIVCRDSPGFVGSRVQAAAMNEAVRAYEDGVADAADIDRALRSGVGFRMAVLGLLEFVDLGGVDILYGVNEYLADELGDRFENPESVVRKIDANELGPTTGRGYYEYDDVDIDAMWAEIYGAMLVLREALSGDRSRDAVPSAESTDE